MNKHPDFIDNISGNSVTNALKQILGTEDSNTSVISGSSDSLDEARISTAYFSPEGFSRIASAIKDFPSIKLMLGSDPIADNERWQRKLDEDEERFLARKFRKNLDLQEEALRTERNHIPFSKNSRTSVKQLVTALRAGNMEVRRYEKNFLHAKAYIFTSTTQKENNNQALIAGSSNLTTSGLSTNLELNLGCYETSTINKATDWFDKLWNDSIPFDLAIFFEEIFEAKTPYEIFLRVLWELYGDEVEEDIKTDKDLPLTTFQRHGVARALRLIQETGGVIVADEVGLGKTFIAADILKVYRERRQRCLLICPAALRDSTWKRFQSDYENCRVETHSFEEIAQDIQLRDERYRPKAKASNLEQDIEEYQLIIIDEAHNYRNPDSPTRANALRSLLYGKRKDVLMLTATPVNNSLWDLYNLTNYFLKQDSFFANKGILSIRERFNNAMQTNPNNLSPDVLYPIVDATTVKRTRQFIKRHYPNDEITINGVSQTIVFPEPKAISVHYDIDGLKPGLFDLIETYLNPEDSNCLEFARYKAELYLKNPNNDTEGRANVVTGLLMSGLLKRFESSTGAFQTSIERLIKNHQTFLEALDRGFVVTTEFLKDSTGTDDEDFEYLLNTSTETFEASLYKHNELGDHVKSDLGKLNKLSRLLQEITPETDPKLRAVIQQLISILKQAQDEGTSREDEIDKRKVLIFSFYADTVRWIQKYIVQEVNENKELSPYKGRIGVVVGTRSGDESDKATVAAKFAPKTAGKPGDADELDILISTDVLAEGVNLQQARHIINYDMPWNPMRLVQRHGRIDRIGSQHNRVFMRTIFPAERLDALLGLEEKITNKIAMAAASIGIVSPISNATSVNRDFTETREEIQKLLDEDASFYERGGTKASVQSGEEYRQTLRKELKKHRKEITQMPWKVGSGMVKGKEQGIFFCAKIGERTYLRFVHADNEWKCKKVSSNELNSVPSPLIDIEIGRCLRLIECNEDQNLFMNESIENAAYDLWEVARENIYQHWTFETDPINLQPKIRPLNIKVADFIRNNIPLNINQEKVDIALEIIESPWPRRDERNLREWFELKESKSSKVTNIIENVIKTGLEPFKTQDPLPWIKHEDIKLLTWMAISSESK